MLTAVEGEMWTYSINDGTWTNITSLLYGDIPDAVTGDAYAFDPSIGILWMYGGFQSTQAVQQGMPARFIYQTKLLFRQ